MMVTVLTIHWLARSVEMKFLPPSFRPVTSLPCTSSRTAPFHAAALMPPTAEWTVRLDFFSQWLYRWMSFHVESVMLKCFFTVLGICGGAFNATASSQTITSPFYPSAYPPFSSCRWVLDAPSQEVVKVSVQQFHLESSQSCTSNFLEFKDFPVVKPKNSPIVQLKQFRISSQVTMQGYFSFVVVLLIFWISVYIYNFSFHVNFSYIFSHFNFLNIAF